MYCFKLYQCCSWNVIERSDNWKRTFQLLQWCWTLLCHKRKLHYWIPILGYYNCHSTPRVIALCLASLLWFVLNTIVTITTVSHFTTLAHLMLIPRVDAILVQQQALCHCNMPLVSIPHAGISIFDPTNVETTVCWCYSY